jgi:hypothetical protein
MTVSPLLDSAGRRRSPATMPSYHAGPPPHNKGLRYPADPPTVEEIIAVLRQTGDDRHGSRLRALIIVLWRGGLRIQEALALGERDLDPGRGSLLVRNGKGGRRREIGIDAWGWEQLRPWLAARLELPIGPLFCVIDGPTRGRPWSSANVRVEFRRLAAQAGIRRRFAPHQLRHAHAVELAREGVALNVIQRQLGHANLGTGRGQRHARGAVGAARTGAGSLLGRHAGRNSTRTLALDHGRPRVGPSMTQDSGPIGGSRRAASHGRSWLPCCAARARRGSQCSRTGALGRRAELVGEALSEVCDAFGVPLRRPAIGIDRAHQPANARRHPKAAARRLWRARILYASRIACSAAGVPSKAMRTGPARLTAGQSRTPRTLSSGSRNHAKRWSPTVATPSTVLSSGMS